GIGYVPPDVEAEAADDSLNGVLRCVSHESERVVRRQYARTRLASALKRVDAPATGEPGARRSVAVRARVAADAPGVTPDRDARRGAQRRRIPVQSGTDSSGVLRVRPLARGVDARAPAAIPDRQLPAEDAGTHR